MELNCPTDFGRGWSSGWVNSPLVCVFKVSVPEWICSCPEELELANTGSFSSCELSLTEKDLYSAGAAHKSLETDKENMDLVF